MILGDWQLDTASGGRFWLDGGAMFGVVPKPVWSGLLEPDEFNRIELDTNCVLARNGDDTVLVDTGYGSKATDKERQQMSLATGEPLVESLAALGVAPEEIEIVLFSHLHFDHAGGATRHDAAGNPVPTFPKATYVAGRMEWEDATSGVGELRGAYPGENLLPLESAGQLRLVEDGEEIVPGLTVRHTGGHTRGHHLPTFNTGADTAIYLGDLCPTHAHMPTLWGMAYDTHPLDTRRRKPEVLGQIADENWLILWDHDPQMAGARIGRNEKGRFEVVESVGPAPRA